MFRTGGRRLAPILSLLCWADLAAAGTLQQSRVGSWTVSSYSDDAGKAFDRCEAGSEPQNETQLLVAVDRDLNWSMGVSGKLGVQRGEAHPVRYRVDRGPIYTSVATAVTDSLVRIPVTDGSFIQYLRFGRQLNVDGGNDRLTFLLTDTAAALGEVRTCAERWKKQGVTLAAADGETKPPARKLTEAERKLEAITVAVNTLSRASITGFELQPPDVPPPLQGHDVTWRAQNLNGSTRLIEPDGGVDVTKIRAGLISADVLACDGRFSADSAAAPGEAGSSLSTLCKAEKGWSRDYLVVARPAGGAYVLSLVGSADQVEPLRAMAAAIRTAALQVIPKAP